MISLQNLPCVRLKVVRGWQMHRELATPSCSIRSLQSQELYEKPFPFDRTKHAACFGDHDNHAANPDADHPLYRRELEHKRSELARKLEAIVNPVGVGKGPHHNSAS